MAEQAEIGTRTGSRIGSRCCSSRGCSAKGKTPPSTADAWQQPSELGLGTGDGALPLAATIPWLARTPRIEDGRRVATAQHAGEQALAARMGSGQEQVRSLGYFLLVFDSI